MIAKLLSTLLFVNFVFFLSAQSEKDKKEAYEIGTDAIKIMDKGAYDESIEMLKKAQKLDPENHNYPYEIGYAYLMKKDYKNAIKTYEKVIKYKEINDQCYTMLGNVYDMNGNPEKAIETYKKGLEVFPESGRLHFEQGTVLQGLKKYNEALASWEEGVEVSPAYPSNYHSASIFFCKYTDQKIWGFFYGELFMNIERGSAKTSELSKLLYDTYNEAISVKSKKELKVTFSKSNEMTVPSDGGEFKLPFTMYFEMNMLLAATSELMLDKKKAKDEQISIQALSNMRTTFIEAWFEKENNVIYPNILFDWHKKLMDEKQFEAYNYWLLMKGNETEFDAWYEENKKQFDDFIEWFTENPMPIDKENSFYRKQY